MLISVTHFFRDREAFDAIERVVVPQLFENRSPSDSIRVWIPGCATGEEAYSFAILLRERIEAMEQPPDVQIFATDIDERAIAIARGGLYPQGIVSDVSSSRLQRFFQKEGDDFRIAKPIRESVLFVVNNVLRDPPFSRLDLISCRNLLIYLDGPAQKSVYDMFRFALRADGHLFLGSSESVDAADAAFRVIDKKHHIYQINPNAAVTRSYATLRSTVAGLKVSNEELQAINEELTTVNYQLKLKVEETVQINDDLQNLIASTDIAVVFVDAAMRIKRFTPRATDLFDLIPGDVGRSLLDITHRLDSEWLTGAIEQTFRKLRVIEREVAGEDGRIWLSRVLPYRTVDNKIDGVLLTFVDLTSRLKAEEKLKVNEERLRIAAETVRDYAIFTMDDAGVITAWNLGAQRAFGYRESEAVGLSFAIVFTPEDRANHVPEAELARALETGSSSDDRWYVKKDGTRFYCSGETTSFHSGDVTGFAKIARDMTGSKLMEARRDEELSRQTQVRLEAEASNRAKDEFLAVMSHELKHPLNLIHVNAEWLSRTPEVNRLPSVKRAADIIRRTVAGQARIIDDLLDLSRARTGKMMMTLVAAPLDAIVTRVVDAARHDAEKKGVTIMRLIAPGVNCTALCDPVRVEQIVWNLLSNAVKFTEPGGEVTVRVTCDDKEASIEVTDTGRGIAPAFLPQVFIMFRQERRGVPDGEGGMGIGLALVKELTEAQGGRVEARSKGEGRGSTFVVRLPLEHGASLPMNADRIGKETLDGLRILAVDDSAEVLEPFAEMMRMDGAHVVEAHSGAEALRALDAEPFDLLLSDIGMPQMDGYQLIDAVRQRNGVHRIVAIALTGYGRASDAQRASEVGFDAHLSKPTSVDDFKTLVGKLREKGVLQCRSKSRS